ncbi:MAG: hypothetical protein LBT68_02245 [Spirochaetales bacterium]|nr:hypothetical protein [Spirochaetales bacterium]
MKISAALPAIADKPDGASGRKTAIDGPENRINPGATGKNRKRRITRRNAKSRTKTPEKSKIRLKKSRA